MGEMEISAWEPMSAFDETDRDELCPHPGEHIGSAFSPGMITKINRGRIRTQRGKKGDVPPKLEFGYVVLRQSQGIVLKQGTPYALVHLGQTFAVKHHFLEPSCVGQLYSNYPDGVRLCECETGKDGFVPKECQDLHLREFADH